MRAKRRLPEEEDMEDFHVSARNRPSDVPFDGEGRVHHSGRHRHAPTVTPEARAQCPPAAPPATPNGGRVSHTKPISSANRIAMPQNTSLVAIIALCAWMTPCTCA